MEIVRFSALERHYGAHAVFDGIAGVIRTGDRIGLVGPNGAGKSSLVRILAGVDRADAGSIVRAREQRLGYLAQDVSENGPQTLRAAFANALGLGAPEWSMRATLNRFNFAEADLDRPFREFSGGQRTRALLARTMLEEPDWLILDEPTNHLDLDTVRDLENAVARDKRAYVIVSHDRYFLETVANKIWELDRGVLSEFEVPPGRAYSAYVEAREARRAEQQRAHEAALSARSRQRAVIEELKTHGSHNYSAVRSREKALDDIDIVAAPRADKRAISVDLRSARRATSGFAVEALGLAKRYEHQLFSNVNAEFTRGERIAIVGPNGAGKTTLLRILAGDLAPDAGSVRYGTGLSIAMYTQRSTDDLPAGSSATEAVAEMGVTDEEARGLLGRLGLGGTATDKPVEAFSGGERRRIMLARLMAQRADALFLDEPTNDLDIPSREALEDVLSTYGGALFVVSHDRFLLQRLGERVVDVRDGTVTVVPKTYAEFERDLHKRPSPPERPAKGGRDERHAVRNEKRSAHDAKIDAQRRKRAVSDAEALVAKSEREIERLEREFAAPGVYDDVAHVKLLGRELETARDARDQAYAAWERATLEFEAALTGAPQ